MSGAVTRLASSASSGSGRARRFAGSQLSLAGSVGVHGWSVRRRMPAATSLAVVRHEIYGGYWRDAADALGAEVEDLGEGLLRLSLAGRSVRVWDNLVPLDHPVALRLASDRRHANAALTARGVRVPRHTVLQTRQHDEAVAFLDQVGTCVVKPAADTGAGTAVTCGVRSRADLAAAFSYAARWGERVIVEEQVVGLEHRVLVLDGAVVGALQRLPPRLVGDGRATVAELVLAENAARLAARGTAGLFPLTLDLDTVATQRRAGRTLRSVVPAGTAVVVKTAVNENGPQQNRGLADLPEPLAQLAVDAVDAVGLRLGAVELVVPPDGTPPTVLEVNSTPGLHYHYQVAEDSPVVPVARMLLTTLLLPDRSPREARPS